MNCSRKSYIIMKDDNSDNMNASTDEKIEKNLVPISILTMLYKLLIAAAMLMNFLYPYQHCLSGRKINAGNKIQN